MARVIYSASALNDLERIYESLDAEDPTLAANTLASILGTLRALGEHPLLGRPAEAGFRERQISRGRTGYVAVYRVHELDDAVVVAAVRHRHEAGYPSPG